MSFNAPPIPVSIGRCADLYSDVKAVRLAMSKEVEEVEAFEKTLKQHIIDNLSKSADTGAAGLKYRAQIVSKVAPAVEDWPAFHKFIATSGRFDLMQRRVADKAVTDMWEAGEAVPGVVKFNAIDVSITKI